MSTPPPTTAPKFEMVDPQRNLHENFIWRNKDAYIVINCDTDKSEEYLRALLPLIESQITSIEFVRGHHLNGQEFIRGVFLVNSDGAVVVHVTNALIGSGGGGTYLSRMILGMFGFTPTTFYTIDTAVAPTNKNYDLILSIV